MRVKRYFLGTAMKRRLMGARTAQVLVCQPAEPAKGSRDEPVIE